jgi:hypothetical protein
MWLQRQDQCDARRVRSTPPVVQASGQQSRPGFFPSFHFFSRVLFQALPAFLLVQRQNIVNLPHEAKTPSPRH